MKYNWLQILQNKQDISKQCRRKFSQYDYQYSKFYFFYYKCNFDLKKIIPVLDQIDIIYNMNKDIYFSLVKNKTYSQYIKDFYFPIETLKIKHIINTNQIDNNLDYIYAYLNFLESIKENIDNNSYFVYNKNELSKIYSCGLPYINILKQYK